ncbi:CU044_5270 family protein [Nonomuraea sp. NPDC050643]|uniref:CU044_5270 family protein n=1 Tax=Nonomuraea sp. NPDC050643 TaxID=3155660 RepID=UPI0033F5388A
MDEDEIRVFADGRPAAPPYRAEARATARERLLGEARRKERRFRPPRLGWQAVAAFGVTVVLVGGVAVTLSSQDRGVSPAASLTQSAAVSTGELDPRPGQYILVESDTMYPSFEFGQNGEETRKLYRTHRKIWQSVDGTGDGLLLIEQLESQPWPGGEPPTSAGEEKDASWHTIASCPELMGEHRSDYAYLSTLPTDPAALRERLYRRIQPDGSKGVDTDEAAFRNMVDLVRERYLPRPQRDAVFEAAKTITGIQVAEGVADSSGRKGVALGMVVQGTLTQAIFDPETHLLLGERSEVVDAGQAQAPKGSVLALTAQLGISVVDALPATPTQPSSDGSCTPQVQPTSGESGAPPPVVTSPPVIPSESGSASPSETGSASPSETMAAVPDQTAANEAVPNQAVPNQAGPTEPPTEVEAPEPGVPTPTRTG